MLPDLTFELRDAAPDRHETPLLAVLLPEGGLPPTLAGLDTAAGGALTRVIGTTDFTGEADQQSLLYPAGPAGRILLVGLGKAAALTPSTLRRAAGAAAKRARALGVPAMALHVPSAGELSAAAVAQAVAEGAYQGAWRYEALKQPPADPKAPLTAVDLLMPGLPSGAEAGAQLGSAIGIGQSFARQLQVLPGNTCTPAFLGEVATDLAKRHGFSVTVLGRAEIEAEGMHALMAVAKGSVLDPRFIVLEHPGKGGAPVVLVGKGITFDTGGISIKPADKMEEMKFDMSGAAAVLGTFEALGRLRPDVRVIGLIPSCENMPSGTAYKPGDVVGSHFGKTIEVINTDAEGRLILCDALSYARRFNPACVLDAATLTGAVTIALGHTAAAVLGTDATLVQQVIAAGERAGERCWELPLWDDYRELIKSDIADVKNSGGRAAGTITGAWFLREFVDGYPWAHIEIAATAYTDKESAAQVRGPTGMGVRLFTEFVLARG